MPETDQTQEETKKTNNSCDSGNPCQDIDLEALAQKIYTLLKQDLKIEQERLGRTRL